MRPSALVHIRIGPLAAALVLVSCGGPPPANETTAAVTRGELVQSVSGSGQIKPAQDINLNFGTTGTVAAVRVTEGQPVKKGEMLADVQRRQYYETFVQAEAAMHSAGQDLTAAQVAYDQARQQEAAEVPLGVAQQKLFGARAVDSAGLRVSNISIQVADAAQIRAVSEQIAAILRERHRLKPDGSQDDFGVFNQADTLASLNQITTVLTAFLGAIAGISLLVGGIGVMNIMLVSVTERTREIGLRKAVGARRRDILTQFLIESVVVSLLGGLIGLLLGSGIAVAVGLSGLITPIVSPSALLLAIGFAAAVGVFFGSYPAQRAARLRPIEALRYE